MNFVPATPPPSPIRNDYDLPDVLPEDQGGSYPRTYDYAFQSASQRTGVPFALIKAHSIRENAKQDPSIKVDEKKGRWGYGLMQVDWWSGSGRLGFAGYTDDRVGDGSCLFDPETNAYLGAMFVKDGLDRFGNVRDAVNAYNTGVAEKKRQAPGNYVNDVLRHYSTLVGRTVT